MKRNITHIALAVSTFCAAVGMSSCQSDFDIDDLRNEPVIVVYCFPTVGDSTLIHLSSSVPIRKNANKSELRGLSEARVEYFVNDKSVVVESQGDGLFVAFTPQHEGDRISLHASCDGFADVSASTRIPESCPAPDLKWQMVTEYDSYSSDTNDYLQLQPTFSDASTDEDFYAVRAYMRYYDGYGVTISPEGIPMITVNYYDPELEGIDEWHVKDSVDVNVSIVTNDEPALQPLSDLDSDFGFEQNFFDGFYIFNDKIFNGQPYTMHLNTEPHAYYEGYKFAMAWYVRLYKVAPELYYFYKSVNESKNNGLAEVGLARLTPTYSNIEGGVGVLGGYTFSDSQRSPMIDGYRQF